MAADATFRPAIVVPCPMMQFSREGIDAQFSGRCAFSCWAGEAIRA